MRIADLQIQNPKSEIRNLEATGVLVKQGDAEGMADGIVRLLTNDVLRKRLGENAVKDAKQRFDLEPQVETYLGWYQDIVKRWNAEYPTMKPAYIPRGSHALSNSE